MYCGRLISHTRFAQTMHGVWLKLAVEMATSGSQPSQELLRKLDEQLRECTPLEESPGEQGHGLDYAVRWDENKKVKIILLHTSEVTGNVGRCI